jgi:hypothetical protein
MTGAEAHLGEMTVALALEPAEGMYEWSDGALKWIEPGEQNGSFPASRFMALSLRIQLHAPDGHLGDRRSPDRRSRVPPT